MAKTYLSLIPIICFGMLSGPPQCDAYLRALGSSACPQTCSTCPTGYICDFSLEALGCICYRDSFSCYESCREATRFKRAVAACQRCMIMRPPCTIPDMSAISEADAASIASKAAKSEETADAVV
ncbi:hypothetical protein FOZ60_004337 [Perkinsus olseni]|uniref:Immunoglobulin super DCC subclass member n=2 Tax=Perkinsus olseni TaxID=32597 RepID=A0A7J6NT50_PEROL|nr:hypothetical protein FOZ60_004337 [Perkinsus olseni]